MNSFQSFLNNLGFSESDLSGQKGSVFTYSLETKQQLEVNYVYTASDKDIYEAHNGYWNENKLNFFIAVCDNKSLIINAKAKPNPDSPVTGNITISSFDFGINSEGFEPEKIREISKDYIDSAYFFEFIIKHKKKQQEVDKDLLLNLIVLRNNLLNGGNDEIIHRLILRCLFVKYLEDRKIYPENHLLNALNTGKAFGLLQVFGEISKINGDIFKYDPIEEQDIKPVFLHELVLFFSGDYRSGQLKLFPYQFDKIPIQLISHVYEAFLRSDEKKGKGIYYTPAFVVNFMLSHSLHEKLKENQNATVFDPAVGSGAFLVESFKAIVQSQPKKADFNKKKEILQNQLFGVDIDTKALQIAAFSLYLALLETEDPEFIREKIKSESPILPSLIGFNLKEANAITDDVFKDRKFDCIVSNPPWGSVDDNDDPQNIKERQAIGNKGKEGTLPEYKFVSDYERSQAFLVRVKKWSKDNTIFTMIVKNSIFLNDNALGFRRNLLEIYDLKYFYELSNYNKILFKKQVIGEINGEKIEIGASEPCAILVYRLSDSKPNTIIYTSPKLTDFAENFTLIQFSKTDRNEVDQNKFIEDDLLWKILVNGDIESYNLIKRISSIISDTRIVCKSGILPNRNMTPYGEPDFRKLVEPNCFVRYHIIKPFKEFNLNQKMERGRDKKIFEGERILIPVRPLKSDKYRARGIIVNSGEIHKHNITEIKIRNIDQFIGSIKPYLAVINSNVFGYYLYQVSSQWDKGEEKREYIRNFEIESFNIPSITIQTHDLLENLVNSAMITPEVEKLIDETVYNLYNLKEYEKEIIREFYQIKVARTGDKRFARDSDLKNYGEQFSAIFNELLSEGRSLRTSYNVSANLGAVICFNIADGNNCPKPIVDKKLEILHFVKSKQLKQADISNFLNEDKIKIYEGKQFYIIKSNLFKDWTNRQAIKDAKEEIGLLLSKLPDTHE